MELKLVKQLKDAGFPQSWGTHLGKNSGHEHILIPTRAMLLEALGVDEATGTNEDLAKLWLDKKTK